MPLGRCGITGVRLDQAQLILSGREAGLERDCLFQRGALLNQSPIAERHSQVVFKIGVLWLRFDRFAVECGCLIGMAVFQRQCSLARFGLAEGQFDGGLLAFLEEIELLLSPIGLAERSRTCAR